MSRRRVEDEDKEQERGHRNETITAISWLLCLRSGLRVTFLILAAKETTVLFSQWMVLSSLHSLPYLLTPTTHLLDVLAF